ncbi:MULTISPECIES: hypothetical protein [unclassified Streptomyces]|uniref:hypothetical protein n=1 Tax=unclassified Streptomyces TaxID=2593676 RepID=UPI0038199AD4
MNNSDRSQLDAPSGLDRRGVMRGATQLGLAGLAAGAVLGAAEPAAAAAQPRDEAVAQASAGAVSTHESLVVHVRDASKGEMDLFYGERHHHVVDRELAAALLRHTR